MQYTEFIHPEDAAALKALKAIPMLSAIVKKNNGCWSRTVTDGTEHGFKGEVVTHTVATTLQHSSSHLRAVGN